MSKYTREKIFIPKTFKPAERKAIAQSIIDVIIARSAAGYDRNNKKFPKYSKPYAEIKGVGTDDVDLILSGEMLDSLELVNEKSGEIVIGYKDPSDELSGKVEGNRIGSYGGEPNKKKARDFLGITKGELNTILDSFEVTTDEPITDEELAALSKELAQEIIDAGDF